MSEDLTNLQQQSDNQILKLILMTLQGLTGHIISFDSRFGSLERHFDRLEGRFDRFEQEMRREIRDLNNTVADVSRNQTVVSDTVRKMDHDFRDIFERLHIVEATRHQQNSTT